ncbi:VCBS repeat-containing protein [Cellulophaga sp. F20128]|uniref:VCBS repeat-containing protein n=1 Tax=Cellulophaga sp. F20128 TaxID=2926413 RepID=UPI001FF67DFD|nr:VCBS repeat-containing protein [Cellulophaga sp. F20128]MCK0156307.1 VCBS repeat-containing protein [Cellulophaga sp. F20128]
MRQKKFVGIIFFLLFFCFQAEAQDQSQLFKAINAEHSQLYFNNVIEETPAFNYYTFMHMYMGGGVATADFNNDQLPDIYFTSNRGANKLFLNKGNFQFEDITAVANVQGDGGFYTGVTTVDINDDGYMDLYVCRSGPETDQPQNNLLYINNGDLSFTESAADYGLAESESHSIQSSFFDYDNDGDLDVYIVNTPVAFNLANEVFNLDKVYANPAFKKYGGADKLYRNNGNNTFTDVSAASGIVADIFFGLTVAVTDFNEDGFSDIFVANDFSGPDFLYMNNGDGTFSNKAQQLFQHTSNYSMGADVADINNDGHQDLLVLDMLPEDYKRSKTSMSMMPREVMYNMVASGYHWQYMHNVLQINNGIFKDNQPLFKDLSYFSGIENTDWSWSCLMADFDLDGFNDIHVTNGILRDVTNMDARIEEKKAVQKLKEDKNFIPGAAELKAARERYPSVKLSNYLFRNKGNLTFEDISTNNVGAPSFSNGSAYADFDNDGDLDLVCNNVNNNAYLLQNLAANKENHFLKIAFNGPVKNNMGYGTKVKTVVGNKIQLKEVQATRGYFSASEPILNFGLGKTKKIDELIVYWPDGKTQRLSKVKTNQRIVLSYKNAMHMPITKADNTTVLKETYDLVSPSYVHTDIDYDDFKDQLLLPHKLTNEGPCMAVADVNNDGLEDFFIGGAAWFTGAIYLQQYDGSFKLLPQLDFEKDKKSEDTAALFFDANGDKFVDLYIVSGSYEMDKGDKALQDRLYLNDGKGGFRKSENGVPSIQNYGSSIAAVDYDSDGDLDIFVGGQVEKGQYPFAANSYLLQNMGNGSFTNVSSQALEAVGNLGMVTDVQVSDFDEDGDDDLLVVGEWMPITFLENVNGTFINSTAQYGFTETSGWWNVITPADIDGDGRMDYILGNLGLNYKFKANPKKPFHIYGDDFNAKGTVDIVLAKDIDNELFPVRGKMCSAQQLPFIKDKFPSFNSFAQASLTDIYGASPLQKALHLQVQEFRSLILKNMGKGKFKVQPLPLEAQYAPINGIVCHDFDGDGYNDLLVAGNKFEVEVETSRADAGTGLLLKGNKSGTFESVPGWESGFFVPGNIKSLKKIATNNGVMVLAGENNGTLKVFK